MSLNDIQHLSIITRCRGYGIYGNTLGQPVVTGTYWALILVFIFYTTNEREGGREGRGREGREGGRGEGGREERGRGERGRGERGRGVRGRGEREGGERERERERYTCT